MNCSGLRRILAAALAAVALPACDPPVIDAQVTLTLLRGDANPLEDPGSAARPSAPVGSLSVSWITEGEPVTRVVPLDGSGELGLRFDAVPSGPARLLVRGLRATDERVYSAGLSVPFEPHPTDPTAVKLFFGPVNAFTPVGADMPGPRVSAAVARLGERGALISGGFAQTATGPALAEPALLVYRLDEAKVCGEAEGCLHGELPPARQSGIAVSVGDGAVLHGLGALADGSVDGSLYLTHSDGRTERLTLGGDPLPPLRGAAAVALPDGSALVIGGHDGTAPVSSVFRIDVRASTATRQPSLLSARKDAGVGVLATGEVLVAGGAGPNGPLLSAELYVPGQGSALVDGGAFDQARNALRGARIRPAIARLADDSIVLMGGGTEGGEVFRLDLGRAVGGFVDLAAPPEGLRMASPAAVRLGDRLLVAGGEDTSLGGPRAALFEPDRNQIPSPSSPSYVGTWTAVGASGVPRSDGALVELGDGSALFVGGGTYGVTADPDAENPPAPRVELFVPMPAL